MSRLSLGVAIDLRCYWSFAPEHCTLVQSGDVTPYEDIAMEEIHIRTVYTEKCNSHQTTICVSKHTHDINIASL